MKTVDKLVLVGWMIPFTIFMLPMYAACVTLNNVEANPFAWPSVYQTVFGFWMIIMIAVSLAVTKRALREEEQRMKWR